MQQFDLSVWLQDKRRKAVTRTGEPVEIINHDVMGKYCIYAKATCQDGEVFNICTTSKGEAYEGEETAYDLFFADEEKELTEFDYAVLSIISDHNSHTDSIEAFAKRSSKKLIDLARKEILKDLPKWKKAKEDRVLEDWVVKFNKDGKIIFSDVVYKGEYFIMLQSLKILPKEE